MRRFSFLVSEVRCESTVFMLTRHRETMFLFDCPSATSWTTSLSRCVSVCYATTLPPLIESDVVLQALLMAVWRRKPKSKVLVHSDQGSQFTSMDWAAFLKHTILSTR